MTTALEIKNIIADLERISGDKSVADLVKQEEHDSLIDLCNELHDALSNIEHALNLQEENMYENAISGAQQMAADFRKGE